MWPRGGAAGGIVGTRKNAGPPKARRSPLTLGGVSLAARDASGRDIDHGRDRSGGFGGLLANRGGGRLALFRLLGGCEGGGAGAVADRGVDLLGRVLDLSQLRGRRGHGGRGLGEGDGAVSGDRAGDGHGLAHADHALDRLGGRAADRARGRGDDDRAVLGDLGEGEAAVAVPGERDLEGGAADAGRAHRGLHLVGGAGVQLADIADHLPVVELERGLRDGGLLLQFRDVDRLGQGVHLEFLDREARLLGQPHGRAVHEHQDRAAAIAGDDGVRLGQQVAGLERLRRRTRMLDGDRALDLGGADGTGPGLGEAGEGQGAEADKQEQGREEGGAHGRFGRLVSGGRLPADGWHHANSGRKLHPRLPSAFYHSSTCGFSRAWRFGKRSRPSFLTRKFQLRICSDQMPLFVGGGHSRRVTRVPEWSFLSRLR